MIFKPTDNIYKMFHCSGEGKNYRESGEYLCRGGTYIEAASNRSKHMNNISFLYKNVDSNWKKIGRKIGYPKNHCFLINDNGDKWLLIKST